MSDLGRVGVLLPNVSPSTIFRRIETRNNEDKDIEIHLWSIYFEYEVEQKV